MKEDAEETRNRMSHPQHENGQLRETADSVNATRTIQLRVQD